MSAAGKGRGQGGGRRVIVGISGASGLVYGIRALELLRALGCETHLVMTRAAQVALAYESDLKVRDVHARADVVHRIDDVGASISSGSFRTWGMLVAPASIRTLSEIATGVTSNLLTRAADVTLKERRPLVLMVRETPLHLGHLRSMLRVAEIGAVVMPPMPAFYPRPKSIEEMVEHTIGRALDQLGIDNEASHRWGATPGARGKPRARTRE